MTTQISDWTDLDNVRNDLSGDYELVNDLDQNTAGYSGTGDDFDPIGGLNTGFSGTFDGQGYAIRDLVVDRNDTNIGLFARVDGVVSDLGVTGASMSNSSFVSGDETNGGVLVGDVVGGTVRRCWTSGTINVLENAVGGVVGEMRSSGTVEKCATAASVQGGLRLGGFAGRVRGGTVADCYAVGSVGSAVNGTAGFAVGNSDTIRDSYTAASVNDSSDVAGFVYDSATTAAETDCYWDTQASGQSTSDGDATGLTTSEMTGASAGTNLAGLTFYPTWSRVDGSDNASGDGYPILRDVAVGPQSALQSVSITDYYLLPQSLTLTATNDPDVDAATVELTWSDSATGEDGYRVYRSDVASPSFPGDFTQVTETTPDVDAYDDDGAAFDTSYEYRVAAFTSSGEAEPRATATVSVASPGPFDIVIVGTNSPVGVGETLEIDVEITNTGSLGGETEATVDLTEQ